MAGRSTFDIYDAARQGRLTRDLKTWRDEDPPVSFDEIVVRLRVDGIVTTSETVRRWCKRIDERDAA